MAAAWAAAAVVQPYVPQVSVHNGWNEQANAVVTRGQTTQFFDGPWPEFSPDKPRKETTVHPVGQLPWVTLGQGDPWDLHKRVEVKLEGAAYDDIVVEQKFHNMLALRRGEERWALEGFKEYESDWTALEYIEGKSYRGLSAGRNDNPHPDARRFVRYDPRAMYKEFKAAYGEKAAELLGQGYRSKKDPKARKDQAFGRLGVEPRLIEIRVRMRKSGLVLFHFHVKNPMGEP